VGPPVPDGVVKAAQGALEPAVPAVLPSLLATKKTTLDEINSLVVNSVVGLLSKFTEQINNKALYFLAVKKGKKDRSDKCNHCSKVKVLKVKKWVQPVGDDSAAVQSIRISRGHYEGGLRYRNCGFVWVISREVCSESPFVG